MKKVLLTLAVLAFLGAGVGLYMYNKPHDKMESARADQKIDAQSLYDSYENDESAADEEFLGKILEVSGTVKEIHRGGEKDNFIILETDGLMGSVKCQLDHLTEHAKLNQIKEEQNVTLKGHCTGYLMDVILDRCVIVKT